MASSNATPVTGSELILALQGNQLVWLTRPQVTSLLAMQTVASIRPDPLPTGFLGTEMIQAIQGGQSITLSGVDLVAYLAASGTLPAVPIARQPTTLTGAERILGLQGSSRIAFSVAEAVAIEGGGGGASLNPLSYDVFLVHGDSYSVGIYARESQDTSPVTGVFQYRYGADTIDNNIAPIEQAPGADSGASPLSMSEWFARAYYARTGRKVILVGAGHNGQRVTGTGASLAVGGADHEYAVTKANAAMAKAQAAYPDSRFIGVLWWGGANDGQASPSATQSAMFSGLTAVIANFRSRITGAASSAFIIGGLLPEWSGNDIANRVPTVRALQQTAATVANVKYVPLPVSYNGGDTLHPSNAGDRLMGGNMDAALADVTAPTISSPSISAYTVYEAQTLNVALTANEYVYWSLSGADAAQFQIGEVDSGDAGSGLSQAFALQWVGNGTKAWNSGGGNTFNVTLVATDGAGIQTTKSFPVTVKKAYGTDAGPVTAVFKNAQQGSVGGSYTSYTTPKPFNAGLAVINAWVSGDAGITINSLSVNGIAATALVATANARVFIIPIGTAGTYSVAMTIGGGNMTDLQMQIVTVNGSTATPTASVLYPNNQDTQTCPANGLLMAMAAVLGDANPTPVSGETVLSSAGSGSSPGYFVGTRNTTGTIGYAGTSTAVFASIILSPGS